MNEERDGERFSGGWNMSKGRDGELIIKKAADDVWRCSNGHEVRVNPLVERQNERVGIIVAVDKLSYGPFCLDCLADFLEKTIPKMVKQKG